MKILIVCDPSGWHKVLTTWVDDLKVMGHEVHVATIKGEENYSGNFKFRSSKLYRLIDSLVNTNNLKTLNEEVKNFDPKLIWFHNINNEWSWSCLLLARNTSIKKIITLHDLASVYPSKIFKNMLDKDSKFLYFQNGRIKGVIYKLRSLYIRFCLSKVLVISIGHLQDKILKSNKINVKTRIENYIAKCTCEYKPTDSRNNTVLFAGRLLGKGLDVAIESVLKYDSWTLLIAGGKELLDFTRARLPVNRYRYLGELANSEVHMYMHSVKFVFVISEYYDNFPTIGIESLVHKSLPLTSNLTGINLLCKSVSSSLVIDNKTIVNLDQLDFEFYKLKQELVFDSRHLTDRDLFFKKIFLLIEN
jgi:glycosyltransferase involved in cell wall biosynthesis